MTYAAGAAAQFTGSVNIVSDYRFRGVSLSHEKPAAQAGIGYDDPSGWYAGVFGSTVQLAGDSATTAQGVAYVGAVTPIGGGFHWDLGAVYSTFSSRVDYSYAELQTAITSPNDTARVHYSPNYFGFARGSFYAEMNRTQPLGSGFGLVGHVGVLIPVGQGNTKRPNAAQNPVDARVGLTLAIAGFNIEVAWVATTGAGGSYPVSLSQHRNTGVASVSWSF